MVHITKIRYESEKVKEWIKKRYMHELLVIVDKIKVLDEIWRKNLKELDKLREKRNKIAKEIGILKREGKKIPSELIKKAEELDEIIPNYEKEVKNLEKEIKELLLLIPNEVDERVPIGPDDNYNKPIKYWGKLKVTEENKEKVERELGNFCKDVDIEVVEKTYHHGDLVEILGLVNMEDAARIAGSRFYIEKNLLVFLDFAVSLYALEFFYEKGFKNVIIPPYFLRKSVEERITYFTAFEDTIFSTNDDLILIPTSEHPIVAIYSDKVLEEKDLPIRVLAWSPSFRREATSGTKDTKGIFRVKQFHKVELHSITTLDKDYEELDLLLGVVEEFVKSFDLPYRVVINSSGDMDRRAKIQYDVEVWFPGQAKFRETHSIATMGDWVSTKVNIKVKKAGKKEYVANLYATGVAVQRFICAILENHCDPEEKVLRLPKGVVKYLPEKIIKEFHIDTL